MPRFSKGTTDHDRDGHMGGSLKENDMTTTKKPAAKPAKKLPAAEAAKDAAAEKFAEADAKADPAQELADLQVERSIRGW